MDAGTWAAQAQLLRRAIYFQTSQKNVLNEILKGCCLRISKKLFNLSGFVDHYSEFSFKD